MEEGGIGIRRIALIQDCLHGKLTWQVLPGVRYGRNLPDPNFIVEEFSSTSIIALLFGIHCPILALSFSIIAMDCWPWRYQFLEQQLAWIDSIWLSSV